MTKGIVPATKGAKETPLLERVGFTSADAVQAAKAIVEAVVEHRRVKQDNLTARADIKAQSAVMRKRIAAQRRSLGQYLDGTFRNRDLALLGLLEALDKGIESGDVELAKAMADRIADIVKSGPLIPAAELNQRMHPEEPVFRIGKSTC